MSGPTPPPGSARRPSTNPPAAAAGARNRSPTPSASAASTPSRTSTLKSKTGAPPSAKAAAKKTAPKETGSKADEDAKAETAALIEDLKEQLRKTEIASEEYQKQLSVAQLRLDEALSEQTKLEETSNQHAETTTTLEAQLRDASRHNAELQTQREADETTWNSEREAASSRESELQGIVQRLKENLAQREPRRSTDGDGKLSRPGSARGRSSPTQETAALGPPPLTRRDSSQSSAQLILQKDRIIEGLRLELAEASLKIMEVDRAGGGRLQELEKKLLEVRMANAKLMEDNESYQFLLQERTLNGDFANKFRAATPSEKSVASRELGNSSLADELETASAADDLEDAKERRTVDTAEKEIASLEDQNKAMKLYIDKIIGKLLASDHYEAVLGGGSSADAASKARQTSVAEDETSKENAAPSLLQRAGSIFGKANSRQRPGGQAGADRQASSGAEGNPGIQEEQSSFTTRTIPTANENPTTAPSVPLRRGDSVRSSMVPARSHRRTSSEWTATMPSYTTRTPSGSNRPTTPSNLTSKHSSLSTSPAPAEAVILEDNDPATATGMTSGTAAPDDLDGGRSLKRATSDSGYSESIDASSVPTSSPPRSTGGSSADGGRSGGGSAAMSSGRQMRPLRLVQEKAEAEAEAKRQSRTSWVGWFNRAVPQASQPGSQPEARPGSGGA